MTGSHPTSGDSAVVDSRKPKEWPEDNVNSSTTTSYHHQFVQNIMRRFLHALFYSYMGPILHRGAELHKQRKRRAASVSNCNTVLTDDDDHVEEIKLQELAAEHVYAVPKSMASQHLADLFWSAQRNQQQNQLVHNMQQQQQQQQQQQRGNTKKPITSKSLTIDFLRVLWILAKPTYLPAGICQFVAVICQCSLPLMVRAVLLRLESNMGEPFLREGLPLAFAIFGISLLEGIVNERQKFLSFQTGIILRSAVVSAAHEHVLAMTPRGRAGLTSGQITNLVAVDAQKLFELTQEGHYSWSCPLAMIIISVLLLLELGVCALVGIVTMFLIVPIVHFIVNKMMCIRKYRVEAADARVEITTAMLQGIRFTKLNRYEERFTERIMKLRRMEITFLKRELFYLALTFVSTVLSPVLASGFTFVAYVLVDDSHILTPSMTFTSLFLFAALRFPINYGGKFMGKAAQGFQACQRFGYFFKRDSVGGRGNDSSDIACYNNNVNDNENLSMATPALEASMPVESVNKLQVAPIVDVSSHADKIVQPTENHTTNRLAIESSPSNSHSKNALNSTLSPAVDIMASFTIGEPGNSFTLSNIEMMVHKSQIMCVVGPVAAGKSILVQGIIGELPSINNHSYPHKCHVLGRIAYASQVPFILNATIRDNILFGEPYDEDRYKRVIEACCLIPDIEMFHGKDLTEIGERGVTLSGGQKQRLAVARVAYSRPDVAVLDDPLSALDADTGRSVFENLFQSSSSGTGLFDGTAVVLVTHAFYFLNMVDSILVLVNGKCAFFGDWGNLVNCHPKDPKEADVIESIRMSVQEANSSVEMKINATSTPSDAKLSTAAADTDPHLCNNVKDQVSTSNDVNGKIMSIEERQHGISQMSTWFKWFEFSGGRFFIIAILFAISFDRFMYVATEWWLAMWTQGAYKPIYVFGREYPAQSMGGSQSDYIITYLIILLVACIATVIRTTWITRGGAICASRLFVLMLNQVVHAPMSFFDTTPIGRLMNRFTYDTETVDVTLVVNMTMLITSSGWLVAGIIIQTIIIPWLLIVLLVIFVNYWLLVSHYRKSAVDLQRLDAMSRSPVQAQLAEAIDGASTIRVFGKTSYFTTVFRAALDNNSGMMMNFMAAQRWLSVRIQMLGATSVLFTIVFVVSFSTNIAPGIAALLIIWSANITISLSFFVQGFSDSEASMTSLERMMDMTTIPQEEDLSHKTKPVDPSWPHDGDLTFDKVRLRYRPGLPLSLDGLTFSVKSGQRCGVVGRTGAGKSTLAAALFRLVEIESGTITLDGVDISSISLADVRGRKNGMAIIPQEPVLLPGTLRQCLDPFGDFQDEVVAEALQSVFGRGQSSDLNAIVEEGGRNFSVGERQLICLARAMLAQPKLLFLDEATASVDGETDAHIQRMLRMRFQGTTLLTIAHRLNTIMDYDVILVVDKGKCAEFGPPAELLSNSNGLFYQLVESTGKESAAALHSMVEPVKR